MNIVWISVFVIGLPDSIPNIGAKPLASLMIARMIQRPMPKLPRLLIKVFLEQLSIPVHITAEANPMLKKR